jgi:hypothetical protein
MNIITYAGHRVRSRDSSVGKATGGLDFDYRQVQDFSLLLTVTGSGVNGYRGSFPRDKASRAWSWPLVSIECRGQEWWIYTSTTPYVFMVWCLSNWTQGQLYLYLIGHGVLLVQGNHGGNGGLGTWSRWGRQKMHTKCCETPLVAATWKTEMQMRRLH